MHRKIIKIDEEKCDGCGLCVPSCVEGALQIVDGKAKLVSEVYCDGLGACLGECPQDALTIEERESDPFDEQAVQKQLSQKIQPAACPGSTLRTFNNKESITDIQEENRSSMLNHWPVQLMLVPPFAPFLKGANLVVCADCVPFAVPDFHQRYLAGRSVLIGCPKLDDIAFYRQKLTEIFREAQPASVTVLRMEVPCCGGIAAAVIDALDSVAPHIPLEVHTIGIKGGIEKESMSTGNIDSDTSKSCI